VISVGSTPTAWSTSWDEDLKELDGQLELHAGSEPAFSLLLVDLPRVSDTESFFTSILLFTFSEPRLDPFASFLPPFPFFPKTIPSSTSNKSKPPSAPSAISPSPSSPPLSPTTPAEASPFPGRTSGCVTRAGWR
jgi:hypothetical protein